MTTFAPAELNASPEPLLDWLRQTGCTKVAIHFDVDCIDSNEIVLGLGADPNGLTRKTVVDTLRQIEKIAEIVGLTVAEYVPRQTIAMQELLAALPLLSAE